MTHSTNILHSATRTLGCAAAAFITSTMLMALAAGPAHANDAPSSEGITKTMLVPYGDLNLASSSGMQTLQHRITAAAKQVCADAKDSTSLTLTAQYNNCMKSAIAGAKAQINVREVAFNSAN